MRNEGPEHDSEPDYRMSLAAERTYLAYVRTGLALVAAGVAVASALPHAGAGGLRRLLGATLIAFGGALFVGAKMRLASVTRAMRLGNPLPATVLPLALTVALCAVAALAAVVIFA